MVQIAEFILGDIGHRALVRRYQGIIAGAIAETALGFQNNAFAGLTLVAKEGVQMVAAVDVLRDIATDKMSETGEEVQLGHYILGQSRPYVALPVNYERNMCAAVIQAVLSAACPASRVVRA